MQQLKSNIKIKIKLICNTETMQQLMSNSSTKKTYHVIQNAGFEHQSEKEQGAAKDLAKNHFQEDTFTQSRREVRSGQHFIQK